MYSIIVFFHVVSALFLGSLLALPLVMNSFFSRTGNDLKTALKTALSFTRASHYALVLLMISGVWMVVAYSSYPSILWIGIAILLLILIGGLIGMLHKNIKRIIFAENPEKKLLEHESELKWCSWITFLLIVASIFMMTNRSLFS
ncbi:hypothetical protein J6TS1_40010 [Siminovitchia terrae]|uniref:Copper resistance protein D domain-containing protein n=1 Tax=Siminovitchia terrae TaxID=1914933 RepID=A0A429X1P9_SIMTE|nr:hypothetical protein [Siminovitchia terrae]RST57404.1 hypothetical protein D5F11_022560 [Siminovitchia terrae]GIN98131.1 hypothetical protein J6TS1_40010 [Siminovitchia terrae]